jgi:hypothetical protein
VGGGGVLGEPGYTEERKWREGRVFIFDDSFEVQRPHIMEPRDQNLSHKATRLHFSSHSLEYRPSLHALQHLSRLCRIPTSNIHNSLVSSAGHFGDQRPLLTY